MATHCPKCKAENPDTQSFCGDCGTQLSPPKDIPAQTRTIETPLHELTRGTLFANRYEIIEQLGIGGMGAVYRVEDMKAKEEIALKLIKPEIAADKKTIDRFRNELTTARKIRHKNICGMYDLGEVKGNYYITMEYVSGEDLKSLLRRVKQIPIGTAISISKQICDGLSEAHQLGIVHRDLKPSNIMIDKAGNARIMDFGIARSIEAKGITDRGVMIGTPDYMSPEQVEGKEINQRSDIYSLGVVLFEMLTGEKPFKGDTSLSVAMKHKSEAPPNPKLLNDQIPDRLSSLVLKCLEKDKERRYQSAEELLSALDTITAIGADIADREKKKKSIAVLPFEDMSPGKDQEYFCDGITEEIINSLTQIRDLRVIARTSSFMFKDRHEDIREIGRKLNVESLLEGSVRKSGNRLRITAQLVDVSDGSHIWSDRFDREMEDVFQIQDEISLAIVNKLKGKLIEKEKKKLTKRYTDNQEAYNLYLKGLHSSYSYSYEGYNQSIEYFKSAIDLDQTYALAYVGLAGCYKELAHLSYMSYREGYAKAKETLKKAIEIDDTIGDAYAILASIRFISDWDIYGPERDFKRAIELSPNSVETYRMYIMYLSWIGKHEESIAAAKQAIELDPRTPLTNSLLGFAYFYAERFNESVSHLKNTLALDPNFHWAHIYLAHNYALMGAYDEAVVHADKVESLDPSLVQFLGGTYAEAKKPEKARKILKQLLKPTQECSIDPVTVAVIYAQLGESEKAFQWLEKGYKTRSGLIVYLKIYGQTFMKNISSDPRYRQLLKKMGFKT